MVFHGRQEQSPIFKNYLDMSVWQLRHMQVSKYITKHNIKKVFDIACSQGQLINRLSRSDQIQLLVGVDIDHIPLQKAKQNVKPQLIQDQISYHRVQPLIIKLYECDIFQDIPPEAFTVNLVTMIEFIEHIPQNRVPQLCEIVFKTINPQHIIITTPNADFNKWFNFKTGQMRHPDHHFEWSRVTFQKLMNDIGQQYDYQCSIFGVGEHKNNKEYGFCSQGALFRRKMQKNGIKQKNIKNNLKLVSEIRYPIWYENIKSSVTSRLTDIIIRHNYSPLKEITDNFFNTKIGNKLKENPQFCNTAYIISQKSCQHQKTIILGPTQQYVLFAIQNCLQYCFYDKNNDDVYYQYQNSSSSELDQQQQRAKKQFDQFKKQYQSFHRSRTTRTKNNKQDEQFQNQQSNDSQYW